MDDLQFYSISVISGRETGDNERLCELEPCFTMGKISASGGAQIRDR